MDREAWRAAVHGVTKIGTLLTDQTELKWYKEQDENSKFNLLKYLAFEFTFEVTLCFYDTGTIIPCECSELNKL